MSMGIGVDFDFGFLGFVRTLGVEGEAEEVKGGLV